MYANRSVRPCFVRRSLTQHSPDRPRGSTRDPMRTMVCVSRLGWCLAPSHRRASPPRSGRLSARARLSRVAATTRETTTIAERAAAGALKGSGPFPLLDPTKGYSHVSPGVCDACADDVEARRAWVRVPPPQPRVPSSRHLRASLSPTPDPRLGARAAPPSPRATRPHPASPLTRCSPPHAGGSSAGPAPLPPRQRRAHPRVSGRRRGRRFPSAGTARGRRTTKPTSPPSPRMTPPRAKAPPSWIWWTRRSVSSARVASTTSSPA